MLMRYLHLALMAATAATAFSQGTPESADSNSNGVARQLAGDFDWDIQPEDGFPSIAFDDTNEDIKAIFKDNFTGILTDGKFLWKVLGRKALPERLRHSLRRMSRLH